MCVYAFVCIYVRMCYSLPTLLPSSPLSILPIPEKINVFRRKKIKEKHQVKEEEAPDDSQKRASTASLLKQGQGGIPFAMSSAECEGRSGTYCHFCHIHVRR